MKKLLLVVKAQPGLMPCHLADDSGDMYFVICRSGGEKAMEKKVDMQRPFYAWTTLEFAGYCDEVEKPSV